MPSAKQYLANQALLVSTVCGHSLLSGLALAASRLEGVRIVAGGLTLPPNTSSPMIRHAAVLITRLLRSDADAMIGALDATVTADAWA